MGKISELTFWVILHLYSKVADFLDVTQQHKENMLSDWLQNLGLVSNQREEKSKTNHTLDMQKRFLHFEQVIRIY